MVRHHASPCAIFVLSASLRMTFVLRLARDLGQRARDHSGRNRDDRDADERNDRGESLPPKGHRPDFPVVDVDQQADRPPKALPKRAEVLRLSTRLELVDPTAAM